MFIVIILQFQDFSLNKSTLMGSSILSFSYSFFQQTLYKRKVTVKKCKMHTRSPSLHGPHQTTKKKEIKMHNSYFQQSSQTCCAWKKKAFGLFHNLQLNKDFSLRILKSLNHLGQSPINQIKNARFYQVCIYLLSRCF